MNYYQLELMKIKARQNLKNSLTDREKVIYKSEIEILEQKQMKLLQEKSVRDEKTGSLI